MLTLNLLAQKSGNFDFFFCYMQNNSSKQFSHFSGVKKELQQVVNYDRIQIFVWKIIVVEKHDKCEK